MITIHGMNFGSLCYQFPKMSDRADLGDREGFDGEETSDDKNGEGVEIVGQEPRPIRNRDNRKFVGGFIRCFDAADEGVEDHTDRQKECCSYDMDPGPGESGQKNMPWASRLTEL